MERRNTKVEISSEKLTKKKRGQFYTPSELIKTFLLPEIRSMLWQRTWVDLYCGEGNLLLPLIEDIEVGKRELFFQEHIRGFDIEGAALEKFGGKLIQMGISEEIIRRNLKQLDTLTSFPLIEAKYSLFHLTNPPYLYRGYIPKTGITRDLLRYFDGQRKGLQDLYQVALFNDVVAGIPDMVYIIPTNFLFGDACSNYIRELLFPFYYLKKVFLFEQRVFKETGTNVCLCWFQRKETPSLNAQQCLAIKIANRTQEKRTYILSPKHKWRAGAEFEDFVASLRAKTPLAFRWYLRKEEVEKNPGQFALCVLDVNEYKKCQILVNKTFAEEIRRNILFLRTLDTGRPDGKAGLYEHREVFGTEGIMVSKPYTYRTHPIQIFFKERLSEDELKFIKFWFNSILSLLRQKLGSDFMTTYREATRFYTRKYLGLNQARKILETCPLKDLDPFERQRVLDLLRTGQIKDLEFWLNSYLERRATNNVKEQFPLFTHFVGEPRTSS